MDNPLQTAIRVALVGHAIGNHSPYELCYARLGNSGGSFGAFQVDVSTSKEARHTLQEILKAAKVDQTTIDRIIDTVSKPCTDERPLSSEDQRTADNALASEAGRAMVDAMDKKTFQHILVQLEANLEAAASVQRNLDPGAQISIALWASVAGETAALSEWIKGTQVNGVGPRDRSVITRADVRRYLEVTEYFTAYGKNPVQFEATVDMGLNKFRDLLTDALSALRGIEVADDETAVRARQYPSGMMENDCMLGYFLTMLGVRALQVKQTVSNDPARAALLAKLESSLATFPSRFKISPAPTNHSAWAEAYRLERILALVEPASNLVSELKRQTSEAAAERIPAASRLQAAFEAALPFAVDTSKSPPALRQGGEQILRPLLIQTLEELHWNSQRKFYARPIQKTATRRIVYLGLAAFALFLAPYLAIYAILFFKGQNPELASWSGLPLYTALTAGLFGAFFSRLLYLQKNWNSFTLGAIIDARDVTSILLRGCVGMTGATIVYFFLQSGAVSGALFPDFAQIGFEQVSHPPQPGESVMSIQLFFPNPALALLVVWCFLAGFSERLVPSILESTEMSLGSQGQAQ